MGKKRKKFFLNNRNKGKTSKYKKKKKNNNNSDDTNCKTSIIFNIPRFSDDSNNSRSSNNVLQGVTGTNDNLTIENKQAPLNNSDNGNSNQIMSYRGYTLRKKYEAIDHISPTSITPKEFFNKYVKERKYRQIGGVFSPPAACYK